MNIRGIRIGPAEIYRVLQDIPELSQALAVAQEDAHEPGGMRMVLLVVPARGEYLTPHLAMHIRREIGSRLTPAHVPTVIAEVAELPVTHSGKLSETAAAAAVNGEIARNRQALRNPGCLDVLARHPALRRRREAPYRFGALPPETPLEVRLTVIWEELFGIAPIKQDDDFFQLGGDSLLAVTLVTAVEEATGRLLPVSVLLETRTIRGLAALLLDEDSKTSISNLVQVRHGEGRPVFFLPGLSGTVLEQHQLLRRFNTFRPIYALQAPGVDGSQEPQSRVRAIAGCYINAVRRVQPHGPYALVGYCFGGLVAYEMAHQLSRSGETVEQVALLDTAVNPRFLPLGQRFRRRLRQVGRSLQRMRGRPKLVVLSFLAHEGWQTVRRRISRVRDGQLADMLNRPPQLQRVRSACLAAYNSYGPPHYDGTVLLLRASERPDREPDPLSTWNRFAARVEVEDIPGTHFALIEEPAVDRVASVLLQRLKPGDQCWTAIPPARRELAPSQTP